MACRQGVGGLWWLFPSRHLVVVSEKLSLWWKVICTSLSNFAAGIFTTLVGEHHSAYAAPKIIGWIDECHLCGLLFELYTHSFQQLLIKKWDPLLQNFPLQNFKCTHLLNRSWWVVRDLGNMKSALINPLASVISQNSFTQLMIGQVTIPTCNLLLRLMSLCHEIWCHSNPTTF